VVTLQSYIWIDEDRADKAFGAREGLAQIGVTAPSSPSTTR
jgi:hypothetical protein